MLRRFGVSILGGTLAQNPCAFIGVSPSGEVRFMSRANPAGPLIISRGRPLQFPMWLKLRRVGSKVAAFTSQDGITFDPLAGSGASIDFGSPQATCHAGYAVTSGDPNLACTAVFDRMAFLGRDVDEPSGHHFPSLAGIVFDRAGNAFFCDRGVNGVTKTNQSFNAFVPVIPSTFSLNAASAIALDRNGFLYVADTGNHRVLRVKPDTTNPGSYLAPEIIAGTGSAGYSGDNGPANLAQLSSPSGLAVGSNGLLYVADKGNSRIRWLLPNDAGGFTIRTLQTDDGSGNLANAVFTNLVGVALDFRARVYVSADAAVRRIDPRDPKVEVIAGIPGQPGYSRDGFRARSAKIRAEGMALDLAGNLYLAEGASHRIRRVDAISGLIATIAGTGVPGANLGDAFSARFNAPNGLAIDPDGNIYVTDYVVGSTIQKLRRIR